MESPATMRPANGLPARRHQNATPIVDEQDEQADVGDGEADPEPRRVVVPGEVLLRVDPLRADAHQRRRRGRRRRAAPRTRLGRAARGRFVASATQETISATRTAPPTRPSRRRRAGRAARTDGRRRASGPASRSSGRGSRASPPPASQRQRVALGSRRSRAELVARRVALGGEPLGELARVLLVACPAVPPSALATTQRTSEATIQSAPKPKSCSCQSQSPNTSVPATPTPMRTTRDARQPQSRRSRSAARARIASDVEHAGRDRRPPRNRKAPVTCSSSSQCERGHGGERTLRRRMDTPRTSPAAADRDDRGRQLDARPARRCSRWSRRRSRTRSHADACFVYLYDERADELVLRATHGTSVEEMTQRPRMRPGEGITGVGGRGARAGDDRRAGASRPALQELPEPARGRVRVDPGGADPRARRDGSRAR